MFYVSLVFIYAIFGNIVFGHMHEFSNLPSAMFTLFKATLRDYQADLMIDNQWNSYLGLIYFNSYLVLNVLLFLNLIVA